MYMSKAYIGTLIYTYKRIPTLNDQVLHSKDMLTEPINTFWQYLIYN